VEIYDSSGHLARHFSSAAMPPHVDLNKLPVAPSWVHLELPPSAAPGMHRLVWDLHYPGMPSRYGLFSGVGTGPWAAPGRYTVKMSVDGRTFSQPLVLKMDPHVKATQADLQKQFDTDQQILTARRQVAAAWKQARNLSAQLDAVRAKAKGNPQLLTALAALERALPAVLGPTPPSSPDFNGEVGPFNDQASLRYLSGALGMLDYSVESADAAPTPDALRAWQIDQQVLHQTLGKWEKITTQDVPRVNRLLEKAGLKKI
jgi:hypothetical protein